MSKNILKNTTQNFPEPKVTSSYWLFYLTNCPECYNDIKQRKVEGLNIWGPEHSKYLPFLLEKYLQ